MHLLWRKLNLNYNLSPKNFSHKTMAIKYGKRTKHNAGTKRTSYNNKTGRTRTTITVKTGNITRSRSRNADGSTRQTTTHKAPNGFITRTSKTIGKPKISKPKAPPKPKKQKIAKPRRVRSSSSSGSRSRSGGSGNFVKNFYILLFALLILYWIF